MDPRPIGIVAPLYPPAVGGVERYVERLASGLASRGEPVEVLVTDPGARIPSTDVRDGVTIHRFPTLRGDGTFFPSPSLARTLRATATRFRVLHAHNLHTLIPLTAAIAARGSGVPLVLTGHYHGTGHTRSRQLLHIPYRPLARRVVRGAARVVFNSEAEREILERDFGGGLRGVVIAEGMDLPDPRPAAQRAAQPDTGSQSDRVVVLAVGRLEPYKSVDAIVAALPLLPATLRLVAVGEGPARPMLESLARSLGVADRVELVGRVSDEVLATQYASAAVFVSLSRHESFGLSVVEAAAAGCPVVASDIAALREVARFVPPGRIRYVPLDASPAALAGAVMAQLALGRVARIEPSRQPTGWALPTWEGVVDRMVGLYDSLGRA